MVGSGSVFKDFWAATIGGLMVGVIRADAWLDAKAAASMLQEPHTLCLMFLPA